MVAAQRRRERRLRSWYRHEQQTIRMALATYTHHSAQRQKTVVEEPKGEVENVKRCNKHDLGDSPVHSRTGVI